MTTHHSSDPIERALESIENLLQNPRLFTTDEIVDEIQNVFALLQDLIRALPPDQRVLFDAIEGNMKRKDRKKLLMEAPDIINVCRDAWQQSRLRHYNEVKRFLKFIYENRRTPKAVECHQLHLVPENLTQYQADLDQLLREGESPEDLEPEIGGAEAEQEQSAREGFIAKEAARLAEEWGKMKRSLSIPALVIDGGYSFINAIAIAQWLVDHDLAPAAILDPDLTGKIALGTTHIANPDHCPVCGHKLPPNPSGQGQVICEECGFEQKKEE